MSPRLLLPILLISKVVYLREKVCLEGNLECILKQNELVSLALKANSVIFTQYEILEGHGQHTAY